MFHCATNGIVAEKSHCHQQEIAVIKGQRIGEEPPDLTGHNCITVKNQQRVQNCILRYLGHQVHQRAAKTDVLHQIGDAFIPVLEAETVESSA